MHPALMMVLSNSQEACLSLWKHKPKNSTKCDALVSAMRRLTRGVNTLWTKSHTSLYTDLVAWRDGAARMVGTMPGIVCPLELLVLVTSK